MRWQRVLRPALGLFALAFALWVVVSIRRPAEKPQAAPQRSDPAAVVESHKGQSFIWKGSTQDVRIDYETLYTYQSGRSKFEGARITVTGRAGRDFQITTNEAEMAENQSQIDLRGAVVITTSDGLRVETDAATYTKSDGVTRAPGRVTFTRARMHESTVSRVVNNKYMHTPQGVFEMKYFFHSGIASSYGEAVSSVTIKQRIRKIIENEDPRKPLSDSKIVNILQREGLVLARRTIAKYREELKIPTSNQRKVLY